MAITGNRGKPIGSPKTGGRKKGTPNRATLMLNEKLDAMSCDPLLELAKIAMNEKNPIEIRVRCFSEIAAYVYPKRKPVDMSSEHPAVINVNTKLDPGYPDGGDQYNAGA